MSGGIVAAISFGCTVLGALIGYLGFLRTKKKDDQSEGESRGVMASDLGYIKAGVDDLKKETRETRTDVRGLSERITRCEESCKQAHHRIDEIVSKEG